MTPLASFSCPTDIEDLMDASESFTMKGSPTKLQRTAGQTVVGRPTSPSHSSSDATISFEVLFDGVSQPYKFIDGAAHTAEPSEHPKVEFRISRKTQKSYLGFLLVLIEKTRSINNDALSSSSASLWWIKPEMSQFTIKGFQIDSNTRKDFRIHLPRPCQL